MSIRGTYDLGDRARQIYLRALEVEAGDRGECVLELCGGDGALEVAVYALLSGYEETDPAEERGPRHGTLPEARRGGLEAGDVVGAFEVLSKLGQGGMASVYRARRRTEAFHQEVALKVLSDALASPEAVARFEFERQVAAALDHPNIAKLIDGGVTPDERPYFALELVEGERIDDYCDRHRLSIEDRVALVISVARAVHYAHENLLVHRDLKPSNILVEEGGRVRLLDFGIAKPLAPDAERLAVTQTGARLLTPVYASPEQFVGGAITTASDQYQIGLILFELVTGHCHHLLDGEDLGNMSRRITDRESPRPSGVVAATGTATSATASKEIGEIAASRRVAPAEFARRLRGDLDTVILKALDKDPARRYRSAVELADDLERFLADEPVEARPSSLAYRVRKFAQRHRLATAAASLGLAALLAGATVATWQAVRAARAERTARAEARTATEVSSFLVDLFEVADPEVARGEEMTAREILERARLRIDDDLAGEPEIQTRMMSTIAEIHRKLGMYSEALPIAEQALAMQEQIAAESGVPDRPEVGRALHALGRLQADRGDDEAALPHFRRAAELFAAAPGDFDLDRARVLSDIAQLEYRRSDLDRAEALFDEALALFDDRPDLPPTDRADALAGLATVHFARSDLERAEVLQREVVAIREADGVLDHPALASALSDLANTLGWEGRDAEAAELHERSLAALEKAYGPDHRLVGNGLNHIGQLYGRMGELARAETAFQRSAAIKEQVLGADHPETVTEYLNLGRVQHLQGNLKGAEDFYRRAIETSERGLGPAHPLHGFSNAEYANAMRDLGRFDQASVHYERARSILEAALGPEHARLAETLSGLGFIAVEAGRLDDAEALYERALAIQEKAFGGDAPPLAKTLNGLGRVERERGDLDAARALHQRARAAWVKAYDERHPATGEALCQLGQVELAAGDLDAAERYFRTALEIAVTAHGPDHVESAVPLDGLATVAVRRGDRDAARELLTRSLRVSRASYGEEHASVRSARERLARMR